MMGDEGWRPQKQPGLRPGRRQTTHDSGRASRSWRKAGAALDQRGSSPWPHLGAPGPHHGQPWPLGLPVPPTPEQTKDRTEKCSGRVGEAPLALPHPPRPWGWALKSGHMPIQKVIQIIYFTFQNDNSKVVLDKHRGGVTCTRSLGSPLGPRACGQPPPQARPRQAQPLAHMQ